ncbi:MULTISPECIES: hypothetical protein [unclassified Streptomyces]|uniref:hypothetical protein n=1 Tax=unclassified Streptomyces TaxID=2593676 RepID=UPI002E198EA3|nr:MULTISPECIES: hypothetical protein [unclassified Streptomyces]
MSRVRESLAAAEGRLLADLDEHDALQLRTLMARVAQTAQTSSAAPAETDC